MKIAIRTELSNNSGTGHFYRSESLANALHDRGHSVTFFIPNCDLDVRSLVTDDEKFQIELREPQSEEKYFDWLIVDSYLVDISWERGVKKFTKNILKVDDLCALPTLADVIINTNLNATTQDYAEIATKNPYFMLGPKFLIFRDEFMQYQSKEKKFTKYVHVFFGGYDHNELTEYYSKLILENLEETKLYIVASKFYPNKKKLEDLMKEFSRRVVLEINPPSIAKTMHESYLAFGAPGITTWERAFMRLPSIYMATNPSQEEILRNLKKLNFCEYLGPASKLNDERFIESFESFQQNDRLHNLMRDSYLSLIDGDGGQRIVDQLELMS